MGALVADGRLGDVIVAPATPPGVSALAVVRLSGPPGATQAVARRLAPRWSAASPRRVQRVRLFDGQGGLLDVAVAVFFRGPRSFTGEDVVEFFTHGSPAIVAGLVESARRAGARPAAPGEFTRRALANGKLDLLAAEGIARLAAASSCGEARRALGLVTGRLSERVLDLRSRLLDLLAALEAGFDFSEDVAIVPDGALRGALDGARQVLAALLAAAAVSRAREGLPRVVILGRPNVGKSSLFNALVGSDRAIVTPRPGTTRDVVSEVVELAGERVKLLDTAGLRSGGDEIERIGVDLSFRAAGEADLVLYAIDLSRGTTPEDLALLEACGGERLVVGTKADLTTPAEAGCAVDVVVSALTGEGLPALRGEVVQRLGLVETEGELLVLERHREALERAEDGLCQAAALLREGAGLEFVAAELRAALAALGEVTGETATEELLDRIFSTFCVGK